MMHGAAGVGSATGGTSQGGDGAGANRREAMNGVRVSRRAMAAAMEASEPCARSHATTGSAASSGSSICTLK